MILHGGDRTRSCARARSGRRSTSEMPTCRISAAIRGTRRSAPGSPRAASRDRRGAGSRGRCVFVRRLRRLCSISALSTSGRPRPAPPLPPLVATMPPSGTAPSAAPIVSLALPACVRMGCSRSFARRPRPRPLINSTFCGVFVSRFVPRPIRTTSRSPIFIANQCDWLRYRGNSVDRHECRHDRSTARGPNLERLNGGQR